ncbi:MAG: hypothetical protein OQK73_03740 [Gammaproteobacteria bacterium]|nr:hypothetical protein [Gammaproteobacteria bacterium]
MLRIHENDNLVSIKMGAFYTGIIAGCSCSDDPSPTDEVNEHCELDVKINLVNGDASVTLSENTD